MIQVRRPHFCSTEGRYANRKFAMWILVMTKFMLILVMTKISIDLVMGLIRPPERSVTGERDSVTEGVFSGWGI